jgi:hypothetical protein
MQQPDFKEFSAAYSGMSEKELMELAEDFDSLRGPAQDALRAEFAARKLEMPVPGEPEEDHAEFRPLVTVRKYSEMSEALIARASLEGAGIEAFLCDENMARLEWQLMIYLGGMRLQVKEEDVAAALEILDSPMPETSQDEES